MDGKYSSQGISNPLKQHQFKDIDLFSIETSNEFHTLFVHNFYTFTRVPFTSWAQRVGRACRLVRLERRSDQRTPPAGGSAPQVNPSSSFLPSPTERRERRRKRGRKKKKTEEKRRISRGSSVPYNRGVIADDIFNSTAVYSGRGYITICAVMLFYPIHDIVHAKGERSHAAGPSSAARVVAGWAGLVRARRPQQLNASWFA